MASQAKLSRIPINKIQPGPIFVLRKTRSIVLLPSLKRGG
jgi:hypothetical protein